MTIPGTNDSPEAALAPHVRHRNLALCDYAVVLIEDVRCDTSASARPAQRDKHLFKHQRFGLAGVVALLVGLLCAGRAANAQLKEGGNFFEQYYWDAEARRRGGVNMNKIQRNHPAFDVEYRETGDAVDVKHVSENSLKDKQDLLNKLMALVKSSHESYEKHKGKARWAHRLHRIITFIPARCLSWLSKDEWKAFKQKISEAFGTTTSLELRGFSRESVAKFIASGKFRGSARDLLRWLFGLFGGGHGNGSPPRRRTSAVEAGRTRASRLAEMNPGVVLIEGAGSAPSAGDSVRATVRGNRGTLSVMLTLENVGSETAIYPLDTGLLLTPSSPGVQTMMTR